MEEAEDHSLLTFCTKHTGKDFLNCGDKMNLQLAAVLSNPILLLQKYAHEACQVTKSLYDHKD